MTTAHTDTAAKFEAFRNQMRTVLDIYGLSGDDAKEWLAAALGGAMPARAADSLAICEGVPDAPLATMAEKPGALVRIMETVKGVRGAGWDILNAVAGIDARTLLGDDMTVRGDVIDALRRCEVALVDTAPEHAAYRAETLRFVRSVLLAHQKPRAAEDLPSAASTADALTPLCDEAADAIERLRDMLATGHAFIGGFSAVPPAGIPVDTLEFDIVTTGVGAVPSREGCECAHHLFAITANGSDDGTGDLWRQYIVSRPGDSVDEAEAAARDAVQAEVPAGFCICGATHIGCVDREVCVLVANYAD